MPSQTIIRSWKNLIESTDNPIIKKGAPSSSNTLNRINQNIQSDIVNLSSSIQDLDRRQRLLTIYLEQQAVGIQALVNSLQTLIPASPDDRGLADFYSTDYIHGDNTARIDQDFGQATLPILSVQEKLHSVDSNGNVWIPEDSTLRFVTQANYTPGVIPSDEYFVSSVEDYKGIGDQPDTFFLGGELSAEGYVFIKANLPQTLNTHRLANRLTFYPVPAFSHALVGAYYRKTDGSWTSIDFNYLPGFTTATNPDQASLLGPTRLHFSPSEVTQVCIVLKASGWWGVQRFSVSLVEYASSANLVVETSSYNPGTISSVSLAGKDQNILNGYSSTVAGTKITVPLSQSVAYTSPIVVSTEFSW